MNQVFPSDTTFGTERTKDTDKYTSGIIQRGTSEVSPRNNFMAPHITGDYGHYIHGTEKSLMRTPALPKDAAWHAGYADALFKLGMIRTAADLDTLGIEGELVPRIIDFLHNNPNPPDDKLHEWADEYDIEKDDLESAAYRLATAFVDFMHSGKAYEAGKKETDFDSKEIAKGIEVEKEHTKNEAMARRIAMDHLTEIPDYYTRLSAMEEAAKKEKG